MPTECYHFVYSVTQIKWPRITQAGLIIANILLFCLIQSCFNKPGNHNLRQPLYAQCITYEYLVRKPENTFVKSPAWKIHHAVFQVVKQVF